MTRGRWYAMASAEFGGLRNAVTATVAAIAAQASVRIASRGRTTIRGSLGRIRGRETIS
jgi:hypothetical protein